MMMAIGHPWHPEMPDPIETPYYAVRHADGQIADEHYCADHLIGEADYLQTHGLADSCDIWVLPVCCEESDDFGPCGECSVEQQP